jgi:hypothetical protein
MYINFQNMAEHKKQTVFQSLNKTLNGWSNGTYTTNIKAPTQSSNVYNYDSNVLLKTNDKAEYDQAKLQLKQDKWLGKKWYNSNIRTNINETRNMNFVDLMYRDVELMSQRPEIYQALTILASEACTIGPDGGLINIFSTSPRIKSILEDLFVNRLQIHLELLPLIRTMLKYGNEYRLLNITSKDGILGWKQMPVTEIKRFNNQFPYGIVGQGTTTEGDLTPYFEWIGGGASQKFLRWQMAHFRLLNDTIAIPYGCSAIIGARQQWRRLTMMEDAMLIYVLEKAFERFVYKVEVGLIEPSDVPAFMQDIANNFKRSFKVDPQTGQLDLSRFIMSSVDDLFIPVRGQKDGTKIEPLTGGGNLDKIKEVLEYVHHQMLTALATPKVFLNFEASPAEGRNLSLIDIRFAKLVNRIQQCTIMELNNIAIIHLFLLGFKDDLNNFTITMNNPSTQAEIMRVEELQKKIMAVKDAVSAATDDGLPIYSWKKALKDIMKFSDEEIDSILSDLRLEKVISQELTLTQQIIKRTGMFDKVDLIYGDPNAQYDYSVTEIGQASAEGGAGGGGGLGGDMGMDDFGGGMEGGDIGGEGADLDTGGETEGAPMGENTSQKTKKDKILTERIENKLTQNVPTYSGKSIINEEYEKMMDTIEEWLTKQD